MKPRARTGLVVSAVSVTASFLMLCAPGAGAMPVPAATSTATWAYGAVRSATVSGTGGTYAYDASYTAGFAVILNESSPSAGNYTVGVHRTMGLILAVQYCAPNCAHPTESATVHFHVWENLNATLNLTTHANVSVSGTPVQALGLVSSTLQVAVGLRESTAVYLSGTPLRTRNLTVNLGANASTSFTPALGLVPLTLKPAEAWNASSNFTEKGFATWYLNDVHKALLNTTATDHGAVSLNFSGPVELAGQNSSTSVRLGGTTYDVVNLTVEKGPFTLREGFLLVPSGADLFGGSLPGWLTSNANDTESASVAQSNVDVTDRLAASSHLGFVASGLLWKSETGNPASQAVSLPGTGPEPAAATAPAASSNATYLQGTPESVGQATTDQGCLTSGANCPGGAGPRGFLGAYLILAAVGAVAVIATAMVASRRRIPSTPYPNAQLYPLAPATRLAANKGRPQAPPAPPAEEDPLGHLW